MSPFGSLMSGGISGLVAWTVIYPIDYVKTLMQSDSLTAPKYASSVQCLKTEVLGKGVRTLRRGVEIMLARAFVCNAVGFACFEAGKSLVY